MLGEGAVTLTLDRASTARARSARVYAHVLEHRAMNDAAHATSMDPTGKPTAELVTDALADAGRSADEVGYYCGHGPWARPDFVTGKLPMSQTLRGVRSRSSWSLPSVGRSFPPRVRAGRGRTC